VHPTLAPPTPKPFTLVTLEFDSLAVSVPTLSIFYVVMAATA